jgi:hypothetical protein
MWMRLWKMDEIMLKRQDFIFTTHFPNLLIHVSNNITTFSQIIVNLSPPIHFPCTSQMPYNGINWGNTDVSSIVQSNCTIWNNTKQIIWYFCQNWQAFTRVSNGFIGLLNLIMCARMHLRLVPINNDNHTVGTKDKQ